MYPDPNSRSARFYREAVGVMPGGNTRTTLFHSPYPIYAKRGVGARIFDVDEIERIDFANNYTALIHGHAHPRIVAAAIEQVQRGASFALPTELEIRLAELLAHRVPSIERIRFTNSGTEAVMMAIKAARAYTGRRKIAKIEGAYHGMYDYGEVALESTPSNWGEDAPASTEASVGTPESVLADVIVLPFNDTEKTARILASHGADLGAVLVDPVPNRAGLIAASHEYLRMLRDFTARNGIVLIFDEVISFRLGYAGAQGWFGVTPDLTTLGKIIGGGFPVGAVGGRADVMSVFDPSGGSPRVPHGGTFSANPVTMAAGLASMELMTPAQYDHLNALGNRVRSNMNEELARSGQFGQVTGEGSLFRIHMKTSAIVDYRSAYPTQDEKLRLEYLYRYLLNHGVLIAGHGLGALSTAMTDADLTHLQRTVLDGIAEAGAEPSLQEVAST